MCNCIQDGFAYDLLVERRNVADEQSVLVMQYLISKVDDLPQLIQNPQDSDAIFDPLLVRNRSLRRTILKDNLGLCQMATQCLSRAQHHQCCDRYFPIDNQFGIAKKPWRW